MVMVLFQAEPQIHLKTCLNPFTIETIRLAGSGANKALSRVQLFQNAIRCLVCQQVSLFFEVKSKRLLFLCV